MSKRQLDYLNELLAAPDAEEVKAMEVPVATSTRERGGSALLSRDNALAKIASGEVKQVTQLLLDPARVRIWAGNARYQHGLSETTCRELIDSILSEGGQKVPAIIRRVEGDPSYDYEVIAGTRRHWAISWLRKNSWPDMMFLGQVHVLDDESAFRLSDVENRARQDVSDYERAINYKRALNEFYGGRQRRMAERLKISEGWLSKMLKVAQLPKWAVGAFGSPDKIQLKTCYALGQAIELLEKQRNAGAIDAMKACAMFIAQRQLEREKSGLDFLLGAEVVREIITSANETEEKELLWQADSQHGRKLLSVLSANRNGITIRLHAGSGAQGAEVLESLQAALAALEGKGRGLVG